MMNVAVGYTKSVPTYVYWDESRIFIFHFFISVLTVHSSQEPRKAQAQCLSSLQSGLACEC